MQEREFILRPSNIYFYSVSVFFLCTFFIILFVSLPLLLKIILLLITGYYGKEIMHRQVLLTADSSVLGIYHQNGDWFVHLKSDWYPAVLLGDSTATQFISILRFKTSTKVYSCVVLRDSFVNCDDYRKLQVMIRHG